MFELKNWDIYRIKFKNFFKKFFLSVLNSEATFIGPLSQNRIAVNGHNFSVLYLRNSRVHAEEGRV